MAKPTTATPRRAAWRAWRRRVGSDAGVTMFELLVVLALISAATAVVMPRVMRPDPVLALRTAAREVSLTLRSAHGEAMRTNLVRSVTFDTTSRHYWVEGSPRRYALPAGVMVSAVPFSGEPSHQRGSIHFMPDGSANGGRILFSSSNRLVAVQVDWLTGETRVVWGR